METRTVNLYRFKELNESVQQKIVNDNINMFDDDFNLFVADLKDIWIDILEKVGFYVEGEKIKYSGFHTQGDGLSFTCDSINTAAVLAYADKHGYEKEVHFLRTVPHFDDVLATVDFYIVRTVNCYVHPYSVAVHEKTDETLYVTQQIRYVADKLYGLIEQVRIDLCNRFYNELEQEWDKLHASDYIKLWFLNDDNNLYFKDGRRWVESEA